MASNKHLTQQKQMEEPDGQKRILDLYYTYWLHSDQKICVTKEVAEADGKEIKVGRITIFDRQVLQRTCQ